MKTDWSHLEPHRAELPNPYHSKRGDRFGQFIIRRNKHTGLCIIATEGDPEDTAECGEAGHWEHVSVHVREGKNFSHMRTPNWEEMCYVKSLFWDDDETVIQYHPAKAEYVNVHNHVLHLWRPHKVAVPKPPMICL